MSDQHNIDTPVENNDDLDLFSEEFYGKTVSPVEKEGAVDKTVVEEDASKPLLDDNEEIDDTGDDDAPAPEEPKKKNRFQERIDQLSEKARLERERADALEARLKRLEENKTPSEDKPQNTPSTPQEPTPDDVDANGDPLYPLGEFDPKFARATIKFALNQQLEEQKAEQAEAQKREVESQQRAAVEAEWNVKLEGARERYPDFQERGTDLIDSFDGEIDPTYGNFLVDTIMQLDNGTDVFYHLAANPEEARAIIAQGALKATVAFGRLDAMFASEESDKPLSTKSVTPRTKTSTAPPPPPRNRGSAGSATAVSPDTEDLAAFEAQFNKGLRRY